ncbi:MAG: PD-(D/E)XK nuclease family protein, partial [Isosphaeraceae bacterium]
MPMAAERVLWTGPYGSGVRDHALATASLDPSALWVVPSPLARDQIRAELAARCRASGTGTVQSAGRIPRVWCWADLWARVRAGSGEGPAVLSDGASGAVFREAIRRTRQAGETAAIEAVLDWPGYRRRLRRRFAAWAAEERSPRDATPALADPVAAAEWAAFRRYRALLAELGAEDEPGLAVWASHRLGRRSSGDASALVQATFLDFESPTRAMWRALDHATRRARAVRVTLGFEAADGDPAGSPYEANADVRDRLVRTLGFTESPLEPDLWRPAGLRDVERAMFRPVGASGSRVSVHQGLAIRGAPVGDGVARMLTREVRDRLDTGIAPDDILVVFRQWGEQADIALEALRDWGIPAAAESRRPLGSDPGVAALLLAIGLPGDEWSTDRVIRLLRNGRIQPGGPGMDPLSMAAAASVVRKSPVFRGRETLLNWLDRAVANARDNTVKAERARLARTVVERVLGLVEPIDRPRPFGDQVDRLFGLARSLGIVEAPEGRDCAGLDRLRDALEDRAAVIDRLGRGGGSWAWADFAEEVESLAAELTVPPVEAQPGSIRLATVDEVSGARALHVILADLAEGTFPGRAAVEAFLSLRPGASADADTRRAFSREMLRFLRVLGASGTSLTLLYPTTDAKGQDLLRAGFLDELMGHLEPSALAACHRAVRRLDPALVDAPELAGSPADLRVRAVAMARGRGDSQALAGL